MALCKAEETLPQALTGFDFGGEIVGAVRYGKGHINDTSCVYTQNEEGDCVRYILQRINTNTFTDPDGLMENIVGVTDYLRSIIEKNGGDAARETMTVLRTKRAKTSTVTARAAAGVCIPSLREPCACKA